MKKMNKKGFTIVELVIVIAVIAILAAVLIPTFSGVVQKANESAALQTATSAMKTVLAQSSSATIANGTYFAIGDKDGVDYLYKYDSSKMGTDNLVSDNNVLTAKTVTGESTKKLNCLIIGATTTNNVTTLLNDEDTYGVIKQILGITGTLTVNAVGSSTVSGIPTNAKYYITVGEVNYGVLSNVDLTKGTVVFTYSK